MSLRDTPITPVDYRPPGQLPPRRPWRPRPLLLAIGLGLLAFAAALLFLFSARAVLIEVQPEPERLQVEGGMTLRWGARYLMLPGDYRIRADKPGYHPLQAVLQVDRRPQQNHRYTLRLLPGRLSVDGSPAGALVQLDGAELGRLPLADAEVEAGSYTLRVSAPRHETLEQDLVVAGGGAQQPLSVQLIPAWAPVSIRSMPAGAQIEVDGEVLGQTPATLELGAGSRRLRLHHPGYRSWETALTVVADTPQTLPEVVLQPADATLRLLTDPAGATVRIGERFVGSTPLTLQLAPETAHTLQLSRDGYASVSPTLRLAADERRELVLTLEPVLATLRLRLQPADAQLRVNGAPRSLEDGRLQLPATRHLLEVAHPGYETWRQELTLRPGVEQALEVRLRSEAEAREAAIPAQLAAANGHALRRLPIGRFVSGSPRNDQGRRANEVQRPVRLTRPYYLATMPVTNAQFRRFEASHVSGIVGRQTLDNEQQPVVRISWLQAVRYCNWLSREDNLEPAYADDGSLKQPVGSGYRLPTESEWEWAARHAGRREPLRYPWGAAMPPPPGSGNFADVSARGLLNLVLDGYDDGYPATSPVGRYTVGAHGLYDLGGNVAEWMHDRYDGRLVAGSDEQVDPFGPDAGGERVIRGSSWRHGRITELRLAYRDHGAEPRDDLGFRVARYAQ
jgi:formylglycine-generating enzyme required for sulfatase activity